MESSTDKITSTFKWRISSFSSITSESISSPAFGEGLWKLELTSFTPSSSALPTSTSTSKTLPGADEGESEVYYTLTLLSVPSSAEEHLGYSPSRTIYAVNVGMPCGASGYSNVLPAAIETPIEFKKEYSWKKWTDKRSLTYFGRRNGGDLVLSVLIVYKPLVTPNFSVMMGKETELERILFNEKLSDATLLIFEDDQTYGNIEAPSANQPAHQIPISRAILASKSDYFYQMFSSTLVESKPPYHIRVFSYQLSTIKAMIEYLYRGFISKPALPKCRNDRLELYRIADQYQIKSLTVYASDLILVEDLSLECIFDLVDFAVSYSGTSTMLLNVLNAYIYERRNELNEEKLTEWLSGGGDGVALLMKHILRQTGTTGKTSDMVCQIVLNLDKMALPAERAMKDIMRECHISSNTLLITKFRQSLYLVEVENQK